MAEEETVAVVAEPLKDKFIEILDSLKEGAATAGEWIGDQAPELAEQIVLRGRVWHVLAAIIGAGVLCGGGFCVRWAIRAAADCQATRGDGGPVVRLVASILGALVGVTAGLTVTVDQINYALTAWLAPKVYVLTYIRWTLESLKGD